MAGVQSLGIEAPGMQATDRLCIGIALGSPQGDNLTEEVVPRVAMHGTLSKRISAPRRLARTLLTRNSMLIFPRMLEGASVVAPSECFCVLPWVHMNLNPDGSVTLCCQSHHAVQDERGTPLNVQTHSLAEIWNASGMRDVRRRMSAGERLPHCEACYSNEAYGRDSYRLASNRRWLKKGFSSAEKIEAAIADKADGQNDLAPLYFDLRLGNLCNLKCTVCKPLYSSQIERDPVHSKWARAGHEAQLDGRFEKGCDWSQSERLLEEIIEARNRSNLYSLPAASQPSIGRR
jgi:hypothetical protein